MYDVDYRENNMSLSEDKPFARPWILNQLAEDISLQDPVYDPSNSNVEANIKDLLLGKCKLWQFYLIWCVANTEFPKTVELCFNNSTLSLYYGCIKLTFEAEFSNVLIVHITCKGSMLPDHELNVQELVRIHLEFVIYPIYWYWYTGILGANCNCSNKEVL